MLQDSLMKDFLFFMYLKLEDGRGGDIKGKTLPCFLHMPGYFLVEGKIPWLVWIYYNIQCSNHGIPLSQIYSHILEMAPSYLWPIPRIFSKVRHHYTLKLSWLQLENICHIRHQNWNEWNHTKLHEIIGFLSEISLVAKLKNV